MVILGIMIKILKTAFNDSKCISVYIFASINMIVSLNMKHQNSCQSLGNDDKRPEY